MLTAIIVWVVVGLIAGFLAKVIVPGPEPGGFVATVLIGIVGAFVGGLLWRMMGAGGNITGIDIGSIFVATVGAIIFLFGWKMLSGRSRAL